MKDIARLTEKKAEINSRILMERAIQRRIAMHTQSLNVFASNTNRRNPIIGNPPAFEPDIQKPKICKPKK